MGASVYKMPLIVVGEPVQIPDQHKLDLVAQLNGLDDVRRVLSVRVRRLKQEIHMLECKIEQIDLDKMDIANQLAD